MKLPVIYRELLALLSPVPSTARLLQPDGIYRWNILRRLALLVTQSRVTGSFMTLQMKSFCQCAFVVAATLLN